EERNREEDESHDQHPAAHRKTDHKSLLAPLALLLARPLLDIVHFRLVVGPPAFARLRLLVFNHEDSVALGTARLAAQGVVGHLQLLGTRGTDKRDRHGHPAIETRLILA